MKIQASGRTPASIRAIQELANFLEQYGEVKESRESILTIDDREAILVAYSSQSYYDRNGYYWFSLAKTKYAQLVNWNVEHAWMVLICGTNGRYFVPFGQIKSLLASLPPNRRDGRWDLYIRLEGNNAFLGITEIKNHLDVTGELHHFEQIWMRPTVNEEYLDEAVYIPDSLPEPDRRTGKVLRVVRDTAQSKIVKELYAYKCQVCLWTVYSPRLKSGWYCEAHHVQPLGKMYRGPDHASNILALCPTHHCLMDLGVLAIQPSNLEIISIDTNEPSKGRRLILRREHGLNRKYLKFHVDNIFVSGGGVSEIRLSSTNRQL